MKNLTHSLTLFVLILCVTFSFLGCNQESTLGDTGSVTIHLNPSDRIISRTIMPDGSTPLAISYYKISGNGPSSQALTEVSSSSASITLDNLLVGNWSFTATAYNSNDKALATGSIDVYINSNSNTIDFPLTQVVGSGNLDLSFTWNTEQVKTDSTFSFSLSDEDGNEYETVTISSNMETGIGSATAALPSGFYRAEATLSSDGVEIAGFSESIRIIDGTTSTATVNLIIGKVIDDVNISITDNTESPIVGTITGVPSPVTVGESVTLTYNATLPEGVLEEDLTYEWYIDGVKVDSATTKNLTINALAGTTRYDVVVGKGSTHSLGSASTSISITPSPSISQD